MKTTTRKYKRRNTIRLKGYNYSNEGANLITISIKSKNSTLGKVTNDSVELSEAGTIVKNEWLRTNITLGEFIIMPDHFNALIFLHGNSMEAHRYAPQKSSKLEERNSYTPLQYATIKNKFGPQSRNLSSIIRGIKGASTKKIKTTINIDFTWQSCFHDRVVRIQDYSVSNPLKCTLLESNSLINFH